MSELFAEGLLEGQAPEGQGMSPVRQQHYYPPNTHQKKKTYDGSVKLSEVFSGFKITINGIVALFFIGYALWLVVIYFIRHNEPLANHVLGTPTAGAPTSHADRLIVGGAKNALPIATTGSAGFYTPDKKHHAGAAQAKASDPSAFYGLNSLGATNHSKIVHGGRERVIIHHPEPLPGEVSYGTNYGSTWAAPATVPPAGQNPYGSPMSGSNNSNNYNVPVRTVEGLRLRTVVGR